MGTALIVCIGNDLAADDGVGHAVYHHLLQIGLPKDARLVLLGVGGLNLLEELAGEDRLVVVDAVHFKAEAGTVHTLDWGEIPALMQRAVSGHGIGIREAIEVGRRLAPENMPTQIYLVGIEGKCFDELGTGLSEEVAAAVETAARKVLQLVG